MKKINACYKPTIMSVKSLFVLATAVAIKEDLPLSSKIKDIIRVCHGAIECNTPKEAVNVLCKGLEYKISLSKWVVIDCWRPSSCIGITNTHAAGMTLALEKFYKETDKDAKYIAEEEDGKTIIYDSENTEWKDALYVIEKVNVE